ncbi:hypothetical protein C7999DRAFT_12963 [Corynascus novoguineensis]|uniref:Uncharacterized protein n=1 Tax=Corynascus novoguineensis TaxID=1126955 RepID=A0AAN7HRM4_9PEZI|nr:hypothetical protein C7999DRAFT_12963 [Corynascus novoguineensis]
MKSPLVYASRCLSDMEDRWIPYSSLWWRLWTPRIPRGERYLEGAFRGYTNGDDDDDGDAELSDLSLLDIRRFLAIRPIRHIYKRLPYIDVEPIELPHEQMTRAQRSQREAFIIESTFAAYAEGKAFYPRQTIAQIEAQLTAAGATLARRRKDALFSHCQAPQTAFLSFPALDGVTTHISTWAPGAEISLVDYSDSYRPGRSQIEFRTIQELTQPDPGPDPNADDDAEGMEPFVPDGWNPAVAYQPIVVRARPVAPSDVALVHMTSLEEVSALEQRLVEYKEAVEGSAEWRVIVERFSGDAEKGQPVWGPGGSEVDKVVFFYGNGMSPNSDYCRRAMFLFAVAVRLRELVMNLTKLGEEGEAKARTMPIYMPAFEATRRWSEAEREFLERHGVAFIESNGALFLTVDERTVVLSYRNWNPVKQIVADIAKPAALICRSVSEDSEEDFAWREEVRGDGETVRVPAVRSRLVDPSSIMVDPDSPRVRKLVSFYDKFELPELPGETAEEEVLSLYVRKLGSTTTRLDYQ